MRGMEQAKCKNCGSALTGEYCAACGQRRGRGDLRLSEALGEVFDEVFSWDSRLWRTLFALIFRPGLLTAEFVAGRRARYVPPFRLYLIISFLTFLTLSVGASIDAFNTNLDSESQSAPLITIDSGHGEQSAEGEEKIEIGIADDDSPQWLQDLEGRIETNAMRLEGDSGSFFAQLLDYLPQLMFFMLPLFALIVQLLYLFSGYYYLQHLVFGLNFHSFVYLLYLLGQAAALFTEALDGFFLLALVLYLPLSLRRVYGSSIAGALAKSVAISFLYGLLLIAGFILMTMVTLALM